MNKRFFGIHEPSNKQKIEITVLIDHKLPENEEDKYCLPQKVVNMILERNCEMCHYLQSSSEKAFVRFVVYFAFILTKLKLSYNGKGF